MIKSGYMEKFEKMDLAKADYHEMMGMYRGSVTLKETCLSLVGLENRRPRVVHDEHLLSADLLKSLETSVDEMRDQYALELN